MNHYDLLIIGAGPGGYVAAIRAAQLGMKAAIIEGSKVGGTCLNRGCIPTKALLHSSHLYAEALSGEASCIFVEGARYDMDKIFARKREVSDTLTSGVQRLLKANKVDVIEGFATILAPGQVSVNGETYTAERILIATGLVPAKPPIPGSDLPGVLTSNDILDGEVVDPKSITIIGGGVIGVELATFYAQLGIKVTIVEALDRLLATLDKEFGQSLKPILKKKGIDVHCSSSVTKIEKAEGGLACFFERKGTEDSVVSDVILIAVGRRPKMEGLLAEGLSLEMNGKFIAVDENFQTSIPGIYAIGNVIGGIQLAHMSSAEGKSAVEKMADVEADTDLTVVPSCIYVEPEIACVGMTADEAKTAGYEIKTGKYLMAGNGKSIIEFQERGFIKVVVNAADDTILGAQLMCGRATDLVGEFATAISNKMTYQDLRKVIRSHPTFAEGITEALEAVEKRSIHSAPVKL